MNVPIRISVRSWDWIHNLRLLRYAQICKAARRLLGDHLREANLLHAACEPHTCLDMAAVLRRPCVRVREDEDDNYSQYASAVKGGETRKRAVLCHLL